MTERAVGSSARAMSWLEGTARQRVAALVDPGSFVEFVGPEQRAMSPHLRLFDLPEQFDDGIVVGRAALEGIPVLLAAQEGRFMGGSVGEVHGAKLLGLLRAARQLKRDVLILFDTGGVRLQEANAGELAISEIMRAVLEARAEGVSVVGLIGGRAGCYGGGSLIAGTCSALIISEHGRVGVSGPEVIETNQGVEEFDSRDRALVWRTMGGKHRYLIGGADAFVDDEARDFRRAALVNLRGVPRGDMERVLRREQQRLAHRLERFRGARSGYDVWSELGIVAPQRVPDLPTAAFLGQANDKREVADEAR